MGKRKKAPRSLREELDELLEEGDNRRQMLQAVVDKAIGGDMKAFEAVREILKEGKSDGDGVYRIELGPGVEELAK